MGEGVDWSFTSDTEVMRCVKAAARKAVAKFNHGRKANDLREVEDSTLDDDYWVAYTELCEYLSTRAWMVDRYRETYDAGGFIQNLYQNGLAWRWSKQERADHQVIALHETSYRSRGEYDGETSEESLMDLAEFSDDYFTPSAGTYDTDLVRRLSVLCWFPERITANADPFGEKARKEVPDRKAASDPSHRNTDVAEMVDIRRAYTFGVHNDAGLSQREEQVLFLCGALDMTIRHAAHVLDVSHMTVHRDLDNALAKLTDYMNNPKGVQ